MEGLPHLTAPARSGSRCSRSFREIPPVLGRDQRPEPRREKYPQCEMQERRQDRGICAQQPTEPAKAVLQCERDQTAGVV